MSAAAARSGAIVVTVDGPAGSGKSTLGRSLAQHLRLPFIDTGLLYRGVMVAAVRAGVGGDDPEAAAALAGRTRIEIDTDPRGAPEAQGLRVDGTPAVEIARDPRHATLLSELSAMPGVRAALLDLQRRIAGRGAVAVGRDCGTVVFPDAALKLFLWAAPEVRARRRAEQLRAAGIDADGDALDAEIAGRDALDMAREAAPLRPADDAHRIDSGVMGIDEMIERSLELCREVGLVPAAEMESR